MEINIGSAIRFVVFLGLFIFTKSQEECQRGGCFPATGDLLVGREDKLKASSTCGLRGRERYCIVSFLDKNEKCFYCDSSNDDVSRRDFYRTSHLPKYAVTNSPRDRLKGWWQSENGVQDVTIQLDLEAEFMFTHLIMTFKTFRPKAMYVERSWNYGKQWKDYRYFAFNCTSSFPNIQRGPQKNIDDVICEERYSKVEPSTEGEVVMKVLDPGLQKTEDPYNLRVLKLLKLTNLRIHFKELHTFGDDVLGHSPEVNQKYYYALYEMVVRGSCSCYGHAEQCIPAEGTLSNINMVHGNCDCKHNTTGRNCEKCKEGYHDEPWRPAYNDQLNVCRKCNCNGHTEKCHFDPAVYRSTGNRSGGVCIDCQHNTAGRQCEQCKALYYRDPFRDITDPLVCKPCDCDPAGSFGGGECETIDAGRTGGRAVAGRCICKANVEGRRCDRCKDGYWNLLESNVEGCQSCNCDTRGTVDQDTCDQKTGNCRCKRNVRGLTCSKCLEGYWNLGATAEGCEECDCDVGGSRNATCDDVSGMCDCRPHLMGRKCDKVRPGYHFANLDYNRFEGENAEPGNSKTPFKIIRKIIGNDEEVKWTGDGYVEVQESSVLDFNNVRAPETGHYNMIIRYDTQNNGDWSDVRVTVTRKDGGVIGGNGCPLTGETAEYRYTSLPNFKTAVELKPSICMQKNDAYKVRIHFRTHDGRGNSKTLIDSIVLLPDVNKIPIFQGRDGYESKLLYDNYNCKHYYIKARLADNAPEICKKLQFSISAVIHNGGIPCNCDPVGTRSNGSSVLSCKAAGGQCLCKPGVVGRHCDRCAPGYFGFGHDGCKACDCDQTGSTSQFCGDVTGECTCRSQIQGRKCDSCPPFHFGFPNCRRCQCNKHSLVCDQTTGKCFNCRHNTAGKNCNLCAEGYYGDATQGTETDCRRCQCPGGSSGNQFSSSCIPTSNGRVICDNCTAGYTGSQCEKCADGYFGNPLKAGGSCKKCNCNGNIDPFADGKCDPNTGKCFNCINNAAGDHCERCKPNYFGSALNRTCRSCICNSLGTDSQKGVCNHITGQCPCLKHVEGLKCDKCMPGFYNMASGMGCLECNCDKQGSLEGSCNQLDGQCRCRVGFGGRNCAECEDFSWGNPKNNTCKPCGCNPLGSENLQCDRTTGECKCRGGVVGDKCDMCAPRTAGVMPKCESCHVCNDQWEDIVKDLEKKIENLLKSGGNLTLNVSDIKLYSKEVKMLMSHLKLIEDMFRGHSVDSADIKRLKEDMTRFRKRLLDVVQLTNEYTKVVQNTTVRDKNANDELDLLELRLRKVQDKAKEFKENVTKIIEGNVDGALNSTLESLRRSRAAQKVVDESKNTIKESKKLRKKIKREVINGVPTFEELDDKNNKATDKLEIDMTDLEKKLEELNRLLCGASKECGGCTNSGCNSCGVGGPSVSKCNGVKQLAAIALKKVNDAKTLLLKKKADAKRLVDDVKMAEQAINSSRVSAKAAEVNAKLAEKLSEETKEKILKLIKDITDFLKERFNHPDISKKIAKETMGLNISLTPDEVKDLALRIRYAVRNLTNVDKILNESQADYDEALKLKEEALRAKRFAVKVMNKTQSILRALSAAGDLQNNTARTINMTRATILDLTDILNQIKEKMRIIEGDLSVASNDTADAETKRDDLKDVFKKNREKLGEAGKKGNEAKEKAGDIKKMSGDLEKQYNNTKEELDRKSRFLDEVRKRVKALDDGAIASFTKASLKVTLLDDLKKSYLLNEKRVKDLSDELRKLTIKAKYVRDRLKKLSQCHSNCNPRISGDICQDQLKEVNAAEKIELDQLNLELQSRNS